MVNSPAAALAIFGRPMAVTPRAAALYPSNSRLLIFMVVPLVGYCLCAALSVLGFRLRGQQRLASRRLDKIVGAYLPPSCCASMKPEAAPLVAADQIRVLALEIDGREHRTAEDFAPQAGCIGLDDVEHALGVGVLN